MFKKSTKITQEQGFDLFVNNKEFCPTDVHVNH